MEGIIENQVLQAAKAVEEQLDAEINRLDKMDDDDLEKLRERRMQAMKKSQAQRQEWMAKGHGVLGEIPSEKDFFDECKENKLVVCHFYKNTTFRCKILDSHLETLSRKHLETKFIKLDVEKAPFLTQRLRIKVIPTLALVIDGKTKDYIVGFTDLGNCDDFSTEMLEWRLGCGQVINYSGDLMNPPDSTKTGSKKPITFLGKQKKTIRGGDDDSDDSDFE
uniref:thioredoxin domain-containing protein 9-like n=1 Tax=Styela clava TaxID=7725 RepID=UPI00193ACAB0|nr:thioredoxin domain-containing protein 9-like [Styela clava]